MELIKKMTTMREFIREKLTDKEKKKLQDLLI